MSFLEGVGAGLGSAAGTFLAGSYNRRSAERMMGFQERMSSSSHRREVEDLKLAGLNPILSANAGSSTPSGAQATLDNPVAAGISSAMQVRADKRAGELNESQIELNDAAEKAQEASAERDSSSAKQAAAQTKILEATIPLIQKESQWDLKTMDARKANELIQQGLGTLNSAKDLVKPHFNPSKGPPIGGQTREKWKNIDEQREEKRQKMFDDAEKLFKK